MGRFKTATGPKMGDYNPSTNMYFWAIRNGKEKWMAPEVFASEMRDLEEYRAKYRLRSMILGAKSRAAEKGLPFSITESDVTIPEFCPVLGIKIKESSEKGKSDRSPSIDRIIPALGYVKGNVIVVSIRANRIKNDATVQELETVAAFYRNKLS